MCVHHRVVDTLPNKSRSTTSARLIYLHTPTDTDTDKHFGLVQLVERTDRWKDRHYQVHYLPALQCYAVDKNLSKKVSPCKSDLQDLTNLRPGLAPFALNKSH